MDLEDPEEVEAREDMEPPEVMEGAGVRMAVTEQPELREDLLTMVGRAEPEAREAQEGQEGQVKEALFTMLVVLRLVTCTSTIMVRLAAMEGPGAEVEPELKEVSEEPVVLVAVILMATEVAVGVEAQRELVVTVR